MYNNIKCSRRCKYLLLLVTHYMTLSHLANEWCLLAILNANYWTIGYLPMAAVPFNSSSGQGNGTRENCNWSINLSIVLAAVHVWLIVSFIDIGNGLILLTIIHIDSSPIHCNCSYRITTKSHAIWWNVFIYSFWHKSWMNLSKSLPLVAIVVVVVLHSFIECASINRLSLTPFVNCCDCVELPLMQSTPLEWLEGIVWPSWPLFWLSWLGWLPPKG